jgi:hypothetical protein
VSGSTHFLIDRGNPSAVRFEEAALPVAEPGEVVVSIDRFALTANNITYVMFGDRLQYWEFFPAPEGWGRVPVWGFGDVVSSRHDEIEMSERIFGLFPPSTHLSLVPVDVNGRSFVDAAPHRSALPAFYNAYWRVAADPLYQPEHECLIALCRPLFMTAFALDDHLTSAGFFGASSAAISSASSKTAIALAERLRLRDIRTVGLTSTANRGFVESLALYDQVVSYDEVAGLDPSDSWLYVDFAGSGPLRAAVHTTLGEGLRHDCAVGASHWGDLGNQPDLPGPAPVVFFAPTQVQARTGGSEASELRESRAAAWRGFLTGVGARITVVEESGREAVERVYRQLLTGSSRPDEGHVLSLD